MASNSLQILIEVLDRASAPIKQIGGALKGLSGSAIDIQDTGDAIAGLGDRLSLLVTAPIVGGLTSATIAAIEFEDVLADTNKALGVTPNSTGAEAVRQEVTELATELGAMPTAIAQMYTEAGKLGVLPAQMQDYNRMVTQAGVAWDIAGEEAASSISQLTNVLGYQDTQGRVNIEGLTHLGDVLNFLGDSGATSESAIAQVLGRVGGSTRIFGLANDSAAGLSAAFLNLGDAPEVVATSMNSMLPMLQNATRQSSSFQEGLGELGLTAEQLETNIKEDAGGAITDLVKRLSEAENTSGILADMFGTGSDAAMLAKASQNYEQFAKTIASVNQAEAGGMEQSFLNRSQTTAAQLDALRAQIFILGASIGSAFLPAINSVVKGLQPLVSALAGFAEAHPGIVKVVTAMALIVASVGPILVAVGSVVTAVGAIAAVFGTGGVFAGLGAAMAGLFGAIAAGFSVIMGPVAVIGTMIASFVGLLAVLGGVAYAVFAIGSALSGTTLTFSDFVNTIKLSLMELPANLAQVPAAIAGVFGSLQIQAQLAIANLRISIQAGMMGVVNGMRAAWAGVTAFFGGIWAGIRAAAAAAINGMVAAISGGAGRAIAAFTRMTSGITNAISGLAGKMMAAGANIVNSLISGITSRIGAVQTAMGRLAGAVRGALPFSPAEYGPLRDIMDVGPNIVRFIADGMSPGPIAAAMQSTLAPTRNAMNPTGGGMGLSSTAGASGATASSSGITLTYSPTINLGTGEGTEGRFAELLAEHRDEILRLLQQEDRRQQRVSYG